MATLSLHENTFITPLFVQNLGLSSTCQMGEALLGNPKKRYWAFLTLRKATIKNALHVHASYLYKQNFQSPSMLLLATACKDDPYEPLKELASEFLDRQGTDLVKAAHSHMWMMYL